MASKKTYWRSVEELNNKDLTEKLASNEFAEEIPVEEFLGNNEAMETTQTSRRDFLKLLGFSTVAVTLAACEAPVVKSIPYVVKPNNITPGVPTWYASTIFDGYDYANVLVKTREGRPIRINANKTAKYFASTNARVQASVLSLYDSDKVRGPLVKGEGSFNPTSWADIDKQVSTKLKVINGKKIVILTSSIPSPTTKKVIADFKSKYPTVEHVVHDAVNYSPALDAAEEMFGQRVLPFYNLSTSELVVSFNADFLGDYNGGGFEGGYAKARKPGKSMLRHIQVESNLSLTGANADSRYPQKQTEVLKTLAEVYRGMTSGTSNKVASSIVKEIKAKGSKAVVLADGNKEAFALCYAINQLINSEAVSKTKVTLLKESNNKTFDQFLVDAKSGNVGALFMFQSNPIYNHPKSKELASAFSKIGLKVAMSEKLDETAQLVDVVAPVPHVLESWNDVNPITGVYSLQQPTIQRIFDTRQFQDSLLTWMKDTVEVDTATVDTLVTNQDPNKIELVMPKPSYQQPATEYYKYLKANWEATILPQLGYSFNQALYNGFNESTEVANLSISGSAMSTVDKLAVAKPAEWELQLYTKCGLGDGSQSNNPWLQELPDPITRVSWDNYLTLNPNDAAKFDIIISENANVKNGRMQFDGDYVNITANEVTLENVPVFIQPGQAIGTVGLALGYGRIHGGKVSNEVGVNAYPLFANGNLNAGAVQIVRSDSSDKHEFACMQMQNTLMGRYEIARQATLADFINKPTEEWNEPAVMPTWRGDAPVGEVDIWRSHDRSLGPHFNLSVDLNACTGCGACIIACQAENNTAVVGKEEMRMSRDMYWLRIDRYYSDTTDNTLTQKVALEDDLIEAEQYRLLIKPEAENPDVIFQPMMCQHCNHAPCETVCPVAATSHGRQGQNMMAYNRCVGTRYCANNCPYKVRRFNWFNYALNDKFDFNMNDDLGRMVLNPDVVVRTRGVMEKCSFCIQETQAAILKAKKEGRKVTDEEFKDACSCAAACGTGAMVFGDVNDSESDVANLSEDKRMYRVIEELGTKPNVFYHVKVKNRTEQA